MADCRDLCRSRNNRMEHFMEICILCLLTEGEDHGYALAERLEEFGFEGGASSIGSLYRTLRKMEASGLVCSQWSESDQGPRKRIYRICGQGREELAEWIGILRQRRQRIGQLIGRYEAIAAGKQG